MSITKVSKKGQITIHQHLRKELGIEPGDILEEAVENGKIVLKRSERPSISLKGIGKKTKQRLGFEDSTEFVRSMRVEEDREEL